MQRMMRPASCDRLLIRIRRIGARSHEWMDLSSGPEQRTNFTEVQDFKNDGKLMARAINWNKLCAWVQELLCEPKDMCRISLLLIEWLCVQVWQKELGPDDEIIYKRWRGIYQLDWAACRFYTMNNGPSSIQTEAREIEQGVVDQIPRDIWI